MDEDGFDEAAYLESSALLNRLEIGTIHHISVGEMVDVCSDEILSA